MVMLIQKIAVQNLLACTYFILSNEFGASGQKFRESRFGAGLVSF
jgi:hypothetical protein